MKNWILSFLLCLITSGIVSAQSRVPINAMPGLGVTWDTVTGTSFSPACGNSVTNTDDTHYKNFTSSSAVAVTLFKAGSCAWAPQYVIALGGAAGSGTITVTPTTSTIGLYGQSQGSSVNITAGQVFFIYTDVSTASCTTNGCYVAVQLNGSGLGTAHAVLTPFFCSDSSGSGTTQVCNTSPTFTPAAGDTILYSTTTANTGDVTVNVNSLGAKHVRKWLQSSTLSGSDLPANVPEWMTYDGTYWEVYTIGNAPSGGGSSGAIATVSLASQSSAITTTTLCSTGTCPSGQYHVDAYLNDTSTATIAGSGIVGLSIGYTDDANAKTYQVSLDGTGVAAKNVALGVLNDFGQATFNLMSTGAQPITYATNLTACTTGPCTYSLRLAVYQDQVISAPSSYSIIGFSAYNASCGSSCSGFSTGAMNANSTAGDTIITAMVSCPTDACSSSSTQTVTFTDNAGSKGGSGNNTYSTDAGFVSSTSYTSVLGHAPNVTLTTSAITGTATGSSANFGFATSVMTEVSGLGTSPTVESIGQNQQNSGSSMTVATGGSCTINDFAWFYVSSSSSPSLPSGWTLIGSVANGQEMGWQKLTNTGTVSVSFTGLSNSTAAVVACYHS